MGKHFQIIIMNQNNDKTASHKHTIHTNTILALLLQQCTNNIHSLSLLFLKIFFIFIRFGKLIITLIHQFVHCIPRCIKYMNQSL